MAKFRDLLEPTLYEKFQDILKNGDEIEIMKFYFNNSIKYKSYKVRKAQSGVNVKSSYDKFYAELDGDFILLYPDHKSSVMGEIVLDNFVDALKRTHDLIRK